MKSSLLAAAALSTLTTLSLSARELMCEQCEPEPSCCEHLFVERSQWFVEGEFLYWTVDTNALDYAVRMNKSTTEINTFAIGDYKTANYDYRPGFRVALSYYCCPKFWQATAQYTYLTTDGSDSTTDPEEFDRFIYPTRRTSTEGPFEKASSDIDFRYHVGDLNVARVFDPNPHLRLRLIGGLTAAAIEQKWKMKAENNAGGFDRINEDWCFWGGGIRLGISADWFWGCQFYLTGKTTFATMIGTYENKEKQTFGVDNLIISDSKYDDHRFTMNAQFLLGPSWQIPCDCWSFELFAGYEFNIWFNLHERIRTQFTFVDDSKETLYAHGLLGVHGLTVRLTLGF
ncbi:MAG: hypothetical protein K1000chlam2_00877 [Chlamydiae bacterium]|nr:hypothetical protein [Chlamydiota bacterium]